jgi:hypothetical protein
MRKHAIYLSIMIFNSEEPTMAKAKNALMQGIALPIPLPVTGTVPEAGKLFFNAGREKSYRLARQNVIPTLDNGSRVKIALLHVLARQLGVDPNNPQK